MDPTPSFLESLICYHFFEMFAEIGLVFGGQLAKFHYYVCWFMQNFSRVYGLVILGVSIFAPSKTSEFHFCCFSFRYRSDSDSSFGRKLLPCSETGRGSVLPRKLVVRE